MGAAKKAYRELDEIGGSATCSSQQDIESPTSGLQLSRTTRDQFHHFFGINPCAQPRIAPLWLGRQSNAVDFIFGLFLGAGILAPEELREGWHLAPSAQSGVCARLSNRPFPDR